MSNWKLVKLDFGNTPAHFGELGIGLEETSERVRSDTLFSALVIAYARLGKDITALLKQFQQESHPPFRLSSTFLFRQFSNRPQPVYYLPKPLKFPPKYPLKNDLAFAKEYKRLKFLPISVWQRWYQGKGFQDSDRLELIATTTKQDVQTKQLKDSYAFSYGQAYAIEKHPKIAIDRVTRATNLYHTAFVRYQSKPDEKSGLYFLIEFNDSNLENDLKAALELLGEEGIGGERANGAGRFKPIWEDLSDEWKKLLEFSKDKNDDKHHSLISLYWDRELISLDKSSYDIQERGGWIASPFSGKQQRRKTVRMFTEGSTFISPPQGKLADVTPDHSDHPVYRSGIALSIPININQEVSS